MREDCKHFQSRTFPNGDAIRKCELGLAPEAPWRCPEECPSFERRRSTAGWGHNAIVTEPTPPEPVGLGDDDSIAALLSEVSDIFESSAPEIMAEVEAERAKRKNRNRGKRKFKRGKSDN